MWRSARVVTGVLLLLGCTAGWNRVVRYSPEPTEESVSVEAYRAVLAHLAPPPGPDPIVTQTLGDFSSQYAVTSMGIPRIPGHWIDSLQHEVRVALENSAGRPADSAEVGQAARALDPTVLPSDTTNWPLRSGSPPLARLRLYRPGFNGDSTIAAVRYDYWCGPMCGAGETLLLARKPGHRWRIWYAFTHWIS